MKMRVVRPKALVLVAALAVVLAGLTGLASVLGDRDDGARPGLGLAVSDNDPATPMTNTRFRMATFNLLGAGHTVNHKKYESGVVRMGYSVKLIQQNRLTVIGVQEMKAVQYDEFRRLTGTSYGVWPADTYHEASMQNSIIWHADTWRPIHRETVRIPYFHGNLIRMPYVLLEHRRTGQQVWFSNFHNPANAHGDAQKWRNQAANIQTDLVNRLRREHPGIPVFLMGDFNERENYFRKVLSRTDLYAANGGGRRPDGTWQYPPRPMSVDWIFGSRDIGMTGYRALRSELVRKATDHPLVMTDVTVPPLSMLDSPIDRVLLIKVDGLRPQAFAALDPSEIPALTNIRSRGASTMNVRTTAESTLQLPNATSMLTGRRVTKSAGGHGVTTERDPGGTVHQQAGRYVSSVFDLAHNFGRSTAFFSQRRNTTLLDRSWDGINGGRDPYQLDYGKDKIDRFHVDGNGARLTDALVRHIGRSPSHLTVVEYSAPDAAGHRHGFGSRAYYDAVRRTDAMIKKVHGAVSRNPATRGRTLVVVVGTHGGKGRSHADASDVGNARVPLLVFGPNVARGGDLLALNPHYLAPRLSVPGYTGAQPIRTSSVANLVLMGLRLPPVTGSAFNVRQDLNPFAGQ